MKKQPSVKTLQNIISELRNTDGIRVRRIFELECDNKRTHKLLQETIAVNESFVAAVQQENAQLRITVRTLSSLLSKPMMKNPVLENQVSKMPYAV